MPAETDPTDYTSHLNTSTHITGQSITETFAERFATYTNTIFNSSALEPKPPEERLNTEQHTASDNDCRQRSSRSALRNDMTSSLNASSTGNERDEGATGDNRLKPETTGYNRRLTAGQHPNKIHSRDGFETRRT